MLLKLTLPSTEMSVLLNNYHNCHSQSLVFTGFLSHVIDLRKGMELVFLPMNTSLSKILLASTMGVSKEKHFFFNFSKTSVGLGCVCTCMQGSKNHAYARKSEDNLMGVGFSPSTVWMWGQDADLQFSR